MSEEINANKDMENEIEKKSIFLSFPDSEVLKFDNIKIILRPYLTINEKSSIIKEYIDILFDPDNDNIIDKYLCAENTLILHIMDVCTNLKIDENIGVDLIIESGLWNNVRERIAKYGIFRNDLEKIIDFVREQNVINKSVGNILDKFAIKVMDILNQIPDLDTNSVKEVAEKFTMELEKLNQTVPGITKTVVKAPLKRGRKKKES
jgi:hypothetical protein